MAGLDGNHFIDYMIKSDFPVGTDSESHERKRKVEYYFIKIFFLLFWF